MRAISWNYITEYKNCITKKVPSVTNFVGHNKKLKDNRHEKDN